MRTFLIKSFLFAAAALLAIQLVGGVFNFLGQKNKQEKINWILSKKDQKYDFAFLGSSRVLNMVDINYLQNTWQIKGINLGTASSDFSDNYLTLYEFYKNGNHANNIFLQVDEQSLDPKQGFGYSFHEQWFFNFLGDKIVDEVYLDNSGKNKYLAWRYLPFLRYMEFNNPYKELILGLIKKKIDYDSTSGSELMDSIDHQGQGAPANKKSWEVSPAGKKYLEKIISLAREHESNVILYTAPYYKVHNDNLTNAIEDYIIRTAHKNSLVFLNFRNSELAQHWEYFRNEAHLDKAGTALFMAEFAPEAKRTLR